MPTSDLQRYPAEVFWSDEDEGFVAVAPDLPGCSAWGADETQALAELRNAIAAWIEAAKAAGNTIPAPSRPADREQFSGKFLVRVPRRLHADLARGAKAERVSLNHYVVYLLTEAVTLRSSTTSASTTKWVSANPVYTASIATTGVSYPGSIGIWRSGSGWVSMGAEDESMSLQSVDINMPRFVGR